MTTPTTAPTHPQSACSQPSDARLADRRLRGLLRLLTPREAQLLTRLAAGESIDTTARALGLTPGTARAQLHRAMRKLGVRTRADAVAVSGLLSPAPPAPPALVRADVFGELCSTAYTRLVQQTFLLTARRRRAVHCVRRALAAASRRRREVSALADPEAWVRAYAFEAALSPWRRGGPRRAHLLRLPRRRIRVRPVTEPDHGGLTRRDRALLRALRRLPRPQRRALVLHDALGLPAAEVAVEVESGTAAAEGRVRAARAALARSVPDLVGPDPQAPGFGARLSELLHRAAVRGCPAPRRPVPVLLRVTGRLRAGLVTGAAGLLTLATGAAIVGTLAGNGPADYFHPAPALPPLCSTATTGSAGPAAPGGLPGVRSAWCHP
ncbi:helix-turn-helix transcriptional regulator [Kitasatospora sp. MAP5-34]|uniref:helix-turn-helix domain-containing protein n=1 Tax=Kitasatospora sp. MAP5-34 TaxID=3035102 RepID=UPI00247614BA|nr:helix-turn-helix transcriptional regulator [Kitasatospora sp. MAP5-34]MDH6578118.1 DNA-directed RNA polymerase specialized sigma24 family protein [Kitasatospora sp. MAP5-34]